MATIKFEKLSAYYPKRKGEYVIALDKIEMTINDGEFFVVVGPSGCGKSTLLKSITGRTKLTEGKLLIDGTPSGDVDMREGIMSLVTQDYSLYPQKTVYENIAYPLRIMRTSAEEIDERVKEIARALDIELLLSRKPRQLSGGQHQRVAIARALVKNPRVLLFDEPFSNLHPDLRVQLRILVKALHEKQRPTVVFVTHDLSEAMYLADRIAVLNGGELEQVGTPLEIKTRPQNAFVRSFFQNETIYFKK